MIPLTQTTACQDNLPQAISCTTGVIQNLNVAFGRTDSSVCCYGNTVNQNGPIVCATTSCYLDASHLNAIMCNSQTNCRLYAPLGVDPCPGIYKYLVASWDCLPPGIILFMNKKLSFLYFFIYLFEHILFANY